MDIGTDGGTKSLFEKLFEGAPRIEVDGTTYWRVEGDTLLDEDQLHLYAEQQEALHAAQAAAVAAGLGLTATTELLGIQSSGKIVRWALGVELTYCVLRPTFTIGGNDGYNLTVESMKKATAEWEATCGVKFGYKPALDSSNSLNPPGALFVVREFNAGGQFIASAFFPNDPVNRRRVLVDPSYYATTFDKVGVLRHELGHVLGFRHEHIRSGAPAGCPDETLFGTIDLTKYDPQSVMHYFCGGVGSPTLAITSLDRSGSQKVYGMSLASYLDVRP